MGIFEGEKDKQVDEINDRILKEQVDDPFSDKFGSIKDSVSSIWKDSSSLWSHALDDPDKLFHQIANSEGNKDKDVWEDFILNASDAMGSLLDVVGLPGGYGSPKRIRALMDDPFTAEEVVQQGVTGFYNYRTPTESQFDECKKVAGLSVWNTKGWWRCLFPEKVVSERLVNQKDKLNAILTKEKVENDTQHKLGLFFPDYTGYLTWKTHMNALIKERKKQQLAELPQKCDTSFATPEDITLGRSNDYQKTDEDKKIIGTSEHITFNYTPDGQEEVKKSETFYDNGTVLVKSERKLSPPDGSEARLETSEKLLSSRDD